MLSLTDGASAAEGEEEHVVEVLLARSCHRRRVYLDDDHLGQKLNLGGQQMARVAGGRVLFESDRGVYVRQDAVGVAVVEGDRECPAGLYFVCSRCNLGSWLRPPAAANTSAI